MTALTLTLMMSASSLGQAPMPMAPAQTLNLPATTPATVVSAPADNAYQSLVGPEAAVAMATPAPTRGRFQSDHAFDGFINPVSNAVLAKDPRSSTWARLLFINNNFPGSHPFGGGNAQAYAMQVNVALTERLTFIADKDGYADIKPTNGGSSHGWLNIAAGFKYAFIRDVENQFLVSGGLMYEVPSGEAGAFQGHGGGQITPFVTWGKEFCQNWHLMATHGYTIGVNQGSDSSFFYHSFHLDRGFGGWFYPLVELNWFQYTKGGNRLPRVIGEGDGLLNLGTQDMQGRQLLTTAVGAKFKLGERVLAGCAYEFPLSNYKGILNNRITVDVVLRY